MNYYDFTQPGGFPFDQGVMKFIQDCIGTAAQTAALAGPLAILSGCTVTGASASDGWVTINGEILPFTGGLITEKVVINQASTPVVFQDGAARVVKYMRTATFGDDGGATNYQWANFKRNTPEGVLSRLENVELMQARLTRVEGLLRPFSGAGGMVWWKGAIADIPTGWREVTDWRGKFPMHYNPGDPDYGNVGISGGAKNKTLAATEIPELKVSIQTTGYANIQGAGLRLVGHSNSPAADDIQVTVNSGGGKAFSILNPFGTGCWIEPIPGTF